MHDLQTIKLETGRVLRDNPTLRLIQYRKVVYKMVQKNIEADLNPETVYRCCRFFTNPRLDRKTGTYKDPIYPKPEYDGNWERMEEYRKFFGKSGGKI